ncbi:hypothetical protein Nepgr_031391 [Nepenthes gracilis]|uniref:AP2/ERF domain-containing protein n=1 Tax=Nepenthes gracilis TaxID=150966 RepID=A0AAD3Y540_NEPGR|nr:hypothetical protein Nepgr_031391 [Nepenthes gracilis]
MSSLRFSKSVSLEEFSDWSADNSEELSSSLSDEVMLASSHPKKPAGRKRFRETRHPVYRGVRQRDSAKWVCEVREPNKKTRIWLGTFPTVEMAARAHDVAVLALRGRSACLNFADSAWRLPVPASTDTKDIQRAAAEAAEQFRPVSQPVLRDARKEKSSGDQMAMIASPEAETVFYTDEEAVFDMPGLLADMYEGLMLPRPCCTDGGFSGDDEGGPIEMDLWS